MLRMRLGGLDGRRLLTAAVKISVASIAMALAAYYAERALHFPFSGDALRGQAVRLLGAIAIGMGVLAACAHLLRIEEFAQVRRRVLRY